MVLYVIDKVIMSELRSSSLVPSPLKKMRKWYTVHKSASIELTPSRTLGQASADAGLPAFC